MIAFNDLTLRRGSKVVLERVNCAIQASEKVGLVGRNGAGKSSLFALLNRSLEADGGSFNLPKEWCIAEVAQQLPEGNTPATDFVIEGDTPLQAARLVLHKLEQEKDCDGHELALAHQAVMDAGSHDAHARAQALLLGLGFTPESLYDGVGQFSGGWQMRLQLARTLMSPSDLLLLDEPTNHLDLDALVWLEDWLSRYQGTLVIISHDRDFLDAMTAVTVHLDQAKLTRYSGNYSSFERQRSDRMVLEQAAFQSQQTQIAHLTSFIERFKAKASKAKQAQSRVKALERMEKLGPILTEADFSFEFRPVSHLPNPMIVLEGAALGYTNHEANHEANHGANHKANHGTSNEVSEFPPKIILPKIDLSIRAGMRLGVLGANGQGKSTLVKSLVGQLPLLKGERNEGRNIVIGYFAQQELDVLKLGDSPLQHLIDLSRKVSPGAKEQELRNFLGQFQFKGDEVMRPVDTMSGGEKARLVLMLIAWQKPNVLILDEPTNHLDIGTRTALSMALNTFDGAVILVSHDRSLLRAVCDEFWLVAEGTIKPFEGGLEDYQKYLINLAKARARDSKASRKKDKPKEKGLKAVEQAIPIAPSQLLKINPTERKEKAKQVKQLKSEATRLEREINLLTLEKTGLEEKFSAGTTDFADSGRRLKAIEVSLSEYEHSWLKVLEEIDSV